MMCALALLLLHYVWISLMELARALRRITMCGNFICGNYDNLQFHWKVVVPSFFFLFRGKVFACNHHSFVIDNVKENFPLFANAMANLSKQKAKFPRMQSELFTVKLDNFLHAQARIINIKTRKEPYTIA